jgi:hypothetical protein
MKNTTLLQVAKTKRFKLRNFEKVATTYAKKTKYDAQLKKLSDDLLNDYYEDRIMAELQNDWIRYDLYNRTLKEAKGSKTGLKSAVNRVMTHINQKTWQHNMEQIRYELELSDATCYQYATKFYLMNYRRINKVMHNILLDLIRWA